MKKTEEANLEKSEEKVYVSIYQIVSGVTDEEYYTFTAPEFTTDYKHLKCKDVICKEYISNNILNKEIKIAYSKAEAGEKLLSLDDGVGIKTLLFKDIESWYHNDEFQAKEQLKDKELEIYRDIIPKLVQNAQEKNQIQHPQIQKTNNHKNLFI